MSKRNSSGALAQQRRSRAGMTLPLIPMKPPVKEPFTARMTPESEARLPSLGPRDKIMAQREVVMNGAMGVSYTARTENDRKMTFLKQFTPRPPAADPSTGRPYSPKTAAELEQEQQHHFVMRDHYMARQQEERRKVVNKLQLRCDTVLGQGKQLVQRIQDPLAALQMRSEEPEREHASQRRRGSVQRMGMTLPSDSTYGPDKMQYFKGMHLFIATRMADLRAGLLDDDGQYKLPLPAACKQRSPSRTIIERNVELSPRYHLVEARRHHCEVVAARSRKAHDSYIGYHWERRSQMLVEHEMKLVAISSACGRAAFSTSRARSQRSQGTSATGVQHSAMGTTGGLSADYGPMDDTPSTTFITTGGGLPMIDAAADKSPTERELNDLPRCHSDDDGDAYDGSGGEGTLEDTVGEAETTPGAEGLEEGGRFDRTMSNGTSHPSEIVAEDATDSMQ